jgi:hypothetical protein
MARLGVRFFKKLRENLFYEIMCRRFRKYEMKLKKKLE